MARAGQDRGGGRGPHRGTLDAGRGGRHPGVAGGGAIPPGRRAGHPVHGRRPRQRRRPLHLRRPPARPARGAGAAQPARQRPAARSTWTPREPCPACAARSAPATAPGNGDPLLTRPPELRRRRDRRRCGRHRGRRRGGARGARAQFELLGFVSDLDEAFERQDFLVEPTENERGDAEAALAAADVRSRRPTSHPPSCTTRWSRTAAVADWREDGLTRLELDPGHLRRSRDQLTEAFGLDPERVRVICEFMGGGFGSKFGVRAAGHPRDRALAPTRPAGAAGVHRREENLAAGFRTPARMEYTIGAVARRHASGGRGLGRDGDGHRRLGLPVLEPVKSRLRLPERAPMVLPVPPEPRPGGRLPGTGRDGGHVGFEQALDELAESSASTRSSCDAATTATTTPATGSPTRPSVCSRATTWPPSWPAGRRVTSSAATAASGAGWAARASIGGAAAARRRTPTSASAPRQPVVTVGMQDLGTGSITACAIVAAERLGVPVDGRRVRAGDTDLAGHGPFSGGSMTLASIAPAVRAAAHHVRTQVLDLAADMFEIAASDLELVDGEVRSADGTLRRPITDVTEQLGNAWVTGAGLARAQPPGMAVNTFGCQIAQVAVDTLTRAGDGRAGRRRARRRPDREPDGRAQPGDRRHPPGRRLRADRGAGGRPHDRHGRQPWPRGLQGADHRRPARGRMRVRRRARPASHDGHQGARRAAGDPDRRPRSETPSRTPSGCACARRRTRRAGCWRRWAHEDVRLPPARRRGRRLGAAAKRRTRDGRRHRRR